MAVGFPTKVSYANGDVFSASDINDTNGTINLLTSTQFAAGKNKIINGDFRFNQRVFTSNTTSLAYNFDRWLQSNSGGTFTLTPQTFTPGAAPVAGYEGSTYLRGITASQSAVGDYALFEQKIEDVRTLAGSTATVSFYAKAATGTPKIGVELSQNFGTGGSPSATVNTPAGSVTLSTSWVRYSISVAVPSITGKTIGTSANSSFLETNLWVSSGSTNATRASSIGIQNNTFDIWGVQVEQSATASSFQTATGTIQGELAACQRYYWRFNGNSNYNPLGTGYVTSTTTAQGYIPLPIVLRGSVTSVDYTNLSVVDGAAIYASTALTVGSSSASVVRVDLTGLSGLTQFRPLAILLNNTANQFLGFSAEL